MLNTCLQNSTFKYIVYNDSKNINIYIISKIEVVLEVGKRLLDLFFVVNVI